MNRLKQRFTLGVLISGILLAATMTPAQAVLAASNDTPSNPSSSQTTATTVPVSTTSDQPSSNTNNTTPSDTSNTPNQNGTSSPQSSDPTTPSDTAPTTDTSDTAPQTQQATSNTPTANTSNEPSSQTTDPSQSDTQNNADQNVATDTQSTAKSGDVSAKGNESVGNVTSGNTSSTINQVTTLNSTTSLNAVGGLQMFTYNIDGNHVGDIVLSPADFLQSSAATATQNAGDASVANQTNGTITNTVNASADSGNVTVTGNGQAGNATSGDAATEANLINMISSVVSDKQAFIGTININGNLKGNLLLPKSAIDSLLPAPSSSKTTVSDNTTSTTTNNMNVNNNVTLDAQSGNVTVTGNGNFGNVTSGNASTNVQLYNLTNSNIVGGNVLLVFVNVMGSWVGLLMNAPAGTTNAALGGGITQDTAVATNSDSTTTTNETINNNVTLKSKSGDVNVEGNQSAGNATSGSASANADIVNILGSQVDLTGWLGVLIINVYGSWTGSLEIQPANVTLHVKAPTTHHKSFHATADTSSLAVDPRNMYNATDTQGLALASSHVLGSSTSKAVAADTKHAATLADTKNTGNGLRTSLIATAIGLLLIAAVASARAYSIRRKKLTS